MSSWKRTSMFGLNHLCFPDEALRFIGSVLTEAQFFTSDFFFFFFQRALICWFIGYTSAPIKFHSITAYFAQQHMERERKVRETFAEDEIEIKPGHRGNFHFFDQIRKKSFGVIWKIITITLIESFWSYMRNWAVSNKQVSGAVFSSALFSDELMTSF